LAISVRTGQLRDGLHNLESLRLAKAIDEPLHVRP